VFGQSGPLDKQEHLPGYDFIVGGQRYVVIGIDPSLTSLGLASPEGLFVVQSKLKGMERLREIRHWVCTQVNVAANQAMATPYLVVEGYAFAKRTSHAHAQGELGGVLRMNWYENDWPYVEVAPTSRAKFATGRGNAGKSEVVAHVAVKRGEVLEGKGSEDMSDAWTLREMALAAFDVSEYEWGAKNLESLSSVPWQSVLQ